MITAKDIREVTFTRSLGGYKTNEVDDFLDRCADAFEELSKMNDESDRKMHVLADTIVDYRNQEDSIRSALISAQRMSESVISDARTQAEDIRSAAQAEADEMHKKAMEETAAELEELRRIKQEVADFKAKLLATYREHLTLIGILEGDDAVEEPKEAAVAEETVDVEEPVEEVAEPVVEEDVRVFDSAIDVVPQHIKRVAPYNLPDFSSLEFIEE